MLIWTLFCVLPNLSWMMLWYKSEKSSNNNSTAYLFAKRNLQVEKNERKLVKVWEKCYFSKNLKENDFRSKETKKLRSSESRHFGEKEGKKKLYTWGRWSRRFVVSSVNEMLEQAVMGRATNELVDCFGVANSDEISSLLLSMLAAWAAFMVMAEFVRLGARVVAIPFVITGRAAADLRNISSTSVLPWVLIKLRISISGIVTTLCLSTNIT